MKRDWTFFSSHGIVLACIAKSPRRTAQEIAQETVFSIRGVQQIIDDLEKGGYIGKQRNGRRNQYVVHGERRLRHRLMRDHTVGSVLQSIGCKPESVPESPVGNKRKVKL